MAVETIAALVTAATRVPKLLEVSADAIGKIRSGWRVENDEAKRELEGALAELRANLNAAGKLAEIGEEYTRVHEEVLELLWDCERARTFLDGNPDHFAPRSPSYAGNWKVIDVIFDSIAKKRDPVRRELTRRSHWYDQQDQSQVPEALNRFEGAYNRAHASVEGKRASAAERELGVMITELEQVEQLLRETMYGKIFPSLRTLAR
jgi:hypothetical protein